MSGLVLLLSVCLLACRVSGWNGVVGDCTMRRPADATCQPRAHNHFARQRKFKTTMVVSSSGLETSGPDAWKKFLGEDDEAVRLLPLRTYEDGLAENRADHIRECNSKPWADTKRFVKKQDRDTSFPSAWTWPAGENIADPERMVAVAENMLVSKEECAAIIAEAEAVAQWTKSFPHASKEREASMPDREKVDVLPVTLKWLRPTLARRLCPAIELAFPGCHAAKAQNLRLYQATVLRYDADVCDTAGPISTPVHQDFSFMTMTIPLNSPDDYHGGGTWIHPLQLAVRPPIGCAVAHAGRVWHAGQPVTKGTRYALALFFHSVATVDHGRRFEQRATTLISTGKLHNAIIELTFSLRAYTEAAVVARALTPAAHLSEGEMGIASLHASRDDEESAHEVVPEGQALWGILANLQQKTGQVDESAKSETEFLKYVERLHQESQEAGCDHPALAGVLHNLQVLLRRKAALS